jgi:integrase
MDATQILAVGEVKAVLEDLVFRSKRSASSRLNLTIFRLACGCGLRRKEISGLRMDDILVSGARPCLRVRKDNTKGRVVVNADGTKRDKRKARMVPLWWDAGTLTDLKEWVAIRVQQGATKDDPLVCGLSKVNFGKRLSGLQLANRWHTAIRCLGPDRLRQVSIHGGRRTFASLSLAAGRSLVEVRNAMGHSDVSTTSIYLYLVEREGVKDIFA